MSSRSTWRLSLLPLLFGGLLLSSLLCPRVDQSNSALVWSLWGAMGSGLSFALIALAFRLKKRTGDRLLSIEVRRAHLIQTCAQTLVYLGWCLSWDTARNHLPLLFSQVMFAYLIDMGISWFRYPSYRLGFGPIPIVLSTNLFLFFTDTHYAWQWVLISVALSSREIFRWRRGGRSVHIFNPSAIALSLCALVLIMTDSMHFCWGEMIALTHAKGPWGYELIFCSGLLVSAFFTVGFTIVSATLTTLVLGEFYFGQTGIYRYLDTGIPTAVFLGMNLLVTDPVSSPWRRDAKILYGALYGISVFILYGALRGIERPPTPEDIGLSAAFCDKLLAVPLLNLLSRPLDGIMLKLWGDQDSGLTQKVLGVEASVKQLLPQINVARIMYLGVWIVLFIGWVRPALKEHPGREVSFWIGACEDRRREDVHPYACENRDRLYLKACEKNSLPACHNLALGLEERDPSRAAHYYSIACEGGQSESCNHLGGLLFNEGEKRRDAQLALSARLPLQRACRSGLREACTREVMLLRSQWFDRSAWGSEDWTEAWRVLEQSCQAQEPYACLELTHYTLPPPQAIYQGCQGGDGFACVALEVATQLEREADAEGRRISRIEEHPIRARARAQLTVACEAELPLSCVNLGWMMWTGDGGSYERKRGLTLIERSCISGFKAACERAAWIKQQPEASE